VGVDGNADVAVPGGGGQPLPISALVASRMSLMLPISISLLTKSSSRGQGRLATSPPETTTSRTPGVARR
jgi:hypothetical protein